MNFIFVYLIEVKTPANHSQTQHKVRVYTSIKYTKILIHSLLFQFRHQTLFFLNFFYFVNIIAHFRNQWKENSSKSPAHGKSKDKQ